MRKQAINAGMQAWPRRATRVHTHVYIASLTLLCLVSKSTVQTHCTWLMWRCHRMHPCNKRSYYIAPCSQPFVSSDSKQTLYPHQSSSRIRPCRPDLQRHRSPPQLRRDPPWRAPPLTSRRQPPVRLLRRLCPHSRTRAAKVDHPRPSSRGATGRTTSAPKRRTPRAAPKHTGGAPPKARARARLCRPPAKARGRARLCRPAPRARGRARLCRPPPRASTGCTRGRSFAAPGPTACASASPRRARRPSGPSKTSPWTSGST